MNSKIFILLASVSSVFGFSQIEGHWQGSIVAQGTELPIIFHVEKKENGFSSNFDSPKQGAKGIPIEKTTFINNEVTFDASNIGIVYKGKFNGNEIDGALHQNGFDLPILLKKTESATYALNRPQEPKPPFDYVTEEVSFVNLKDKNTLAGTLSLPKNKKDFPVVVLITGSGQQNRDEEILGHKPFAVIADDFAKKGIATLRLDDRGIGDSSAGSPNDTSESFAGDSNAAVDFLVKKGYKNIGLVGHSEGGMIAPIVALENKNVKFIVSMAGVGIPVLDLMLIQNQNIDRLSGASEKQIQEDIALKKHYFEYLAQYKGSNFENDVQKEMNVFFEKNKSELSKEAQSQIVTTLIQQTNNQWFRYFIRYQPEPCLRKIKIPVLAINGSLDMQVSPKENLEGFRKNLELAGNKNFKIVELPQLNHLFQTAETGSPQEYATIEETISPKALDLMSSWILNLK